MEGFLKSFDKNNNGVIESSEVDERSQRFVTRMAERAGMKPELPISIEQLRKGLTESEGRGREGGPPGGGSPGGSPEAPKSSGRSAMPKSNVPGFGAQAKPATTASFGPPAAKQPSPRPQGAATATAPAAPAAAQPSQPPPDAGGPERGGNDERIRRMASAMMQRQDKNGNGQLDREEWADMQDRLAPADTNHDGIVTLDELTAWLARFGRSSGGDRGGRGGPPGSGSPNGTGGTSPDGRRSYRFRTATERLPEGLPPWFAERDANGDGQVAMAEFASLWSESKVSEYARYDLNADGIITPHECLRARR